MKGTEQVLNCGLTDGLRVAAQDALMFALLLLDAALHGDEGSIHPLGEALLDLLVVVLHLVWIRTNKQFVAVVYFS